mmetsp:Transcript_5244/g.7893  ORF Transcript_5244/g.7893 Transcript_5244/m.7893 type:complete len:205 (-) Transcript_5244:619-1233(-)
MCLLDSDLLANEVRSLGTILVGNDWLVSSTSLIGTESTISAVNRASPKCRLIMIDFVHSFAFELFLQKLGVISSSNSVGRNEENKSSSEYMSTPIGVEAAHSRPVGLNLMHVTLAASLVRRLPNFDRFAPGKDSLSFSSSDSLNGSSSKGPASVNLSLLSLSNTPSKPLLCVIWNFRIKTPFALEYKQTLFVSPETIIPEPSVE